MSEPIISPWIIYAIDVAIGFKAALDFITVLLVIALGVFVIAFFAAIVASDCDDTKLLQKEVAKHKKKMCIALAVCVVLEILTPTKQAVQTMVVLSFITPDNIALVQDNIIDFVEKVVKAIKAVK